MSNSLFTLGSKLSKIPSGTHLNSWPSGKDSYDSLINCLNSHMETSTNIGEAPLNEWGQASWYEVMEIALPQAKGSKSEVTPKLLENEISASFMMESNAIAWDNTKGNSVNIDSNKIQSNYDFIVLKVPKSMNVPNSEVSLKHEDFLNGKWFFIQIIHFLT